MWIKVDLEYVCFVDLSVISLLEYLVCFDVRYLYDVEYIVEVYWNLWDENIKFVV